jgi:hypothetical protein
VAAGVAAVRTLDGRPLTDGLAQTDKLRHAARRGGQPVVVVEWASHRWQPLELD